MSNFVEACLPSPLRAKLPLYPTRIEDSQPSHHFLTEQNTHKHLILELTLSKMARYKLDIQKRQHRERSQPLNRARLGLLEKHKDYVKRAKDYHSKQDRIKKLREKASLKNPDEFYFEMINSRTEKGVHIKSRGNKALDNDLVVLLKTQDFNYVKTCRTIEERVRRLFFFFWNIHRK